MMVLTGKWLLIVAAVAVIHWLIPPKWRGGFVIAATAVFLGILSPISLAILTILTVLFHFLAGRYNHISGHRLVALIIAAGGVLSLYKAYASFKPMGIDLDPLTEDYIIPLGLSYYAFRCIHYGIEKYKGTIPAHGFYEFAQYLFFLPTLLAGPIHRFHDFQSDLNRKRWDPFMFAQGLERMMFGYFKVAFMANLVVNNWLGLVIMEVEKTNVALGAYLEMVKISTNLYFQFAGYSDIAIGFGMLLGVKVMENFNFPFLARNISDFWTRWHISLTSWCKDYVYMGTISVTRSAALAAIAAMVVMGLWHEFSLRYLLWGLYQGAGIMLWQQFQHIKAKLPHTTNAVAVTSWRIFATLLTLNYFMFGVLIAHHKTLESAWEEASKILLFWL